MVCEVSNWVIEQAQKPFERVVASEIYSKLLAPLTVVLLQCSWIFFQDFQPCPFLSATTVVLRSSSLLATSVELGPTIEAP